VSLPRPLRFPPIDGEPVPAAASPSSAPLGSDDLVTGAVGCCLSPRPLPSARRIRLSLVRSPLLAGEPVHCAGLPVVDGSVDLVTGALILLSYPYSVTLILDLVTDLRVSSPPVASSVDLVLRRAGMLLSLPHLFRVSSSTKTSPLCM
jgi:hypothetical protein